MLEFEREDERLRQAVGADVRTILSSTVGLADRFQLAQARLQELAEEASPDDRMLLERDRLASFFGCAYGDAGLLARAGAVLTLRDRLARLATLAPHLVEDPQGSARAQREAVILRTFAREHLARLPAGRDGLDLFEIVSSAARVTIAYADFVASAKAIDADAGGYLGCRALWAASDLAYIAADESPQRPLVTIAAWAAGRVADYLAGPSGSGAYDALCEAHVLSLRRELWEASEAQFARRKGPAPLSAIEQADYDLESLFGALKDPRLKSADRARAVGGLYAFVTALRAGQAALAADSALGSTLLLIDEGLRAESRGAA